MEKYRIKKIYDRYHIEVKKERKRFLRKSVFEWRDLGTFFFVYNGKVCGHPFRTIETAQAYIKLKQDEYHRKYDKPEYVYENTDEEV